MLPWQQTEIIPDHLEVNSIKYLGLKIGLTVYMLLSSLVLWAQEDDDDEEEVFVPRGMEEELDMEQIDTPMLNISPTDILVIIAVLAVAYLLSRIWKGCSWAFIVVMLAIYFLNTYYY